MEKHLNTQAGSIKYNRYGPRYPSKTRGLISLNGRMLRIRLPLKGSYTFTAFDARGRNSIAQKFDTAGKSVHTVDVATLPSGVYTTTLTGAAFRVADKFFLCD
jgi:hypothetical protein